MHVLGWHSLGTIFRPAFQELNITLRSEKTTGYARLYGLTGEVEKKTYRFLMR